jgi:hypothetical protein
VLQSRLATTDGTLVHAPSEMRPSPSTSAVSIRIFMSSEPISPNPRFWKMDRRT